MTAATACVTPTLDATAPMLQVFDEVLPRPDWYRQWALRQSFQTHRTGDEDWHGIALLAESALPHLIAERFPGAETKFTFLRRSPLGQAEPNFIHSDEGMGEWTGILYLNPEPAPGDGTTFWRFLPTGETYGSARALDKAPASWAAWHHVPARYNRLLVFDSLYFHSRAIEENYGAGEEARLVQVAFGTRPVAARTTMREARLDDVPALVAMGQRFRAATIYATRVPENPWQMAETASRLIRSDEALVLVVEHAGVLIGMMGLLLFPNHISGLLTAGEVFFWVEPDHRGYGLRLFRRAEQWARARGAERMQMICPWGSGDVGQLYERLGYAPLEVAYEKRLTPEGVPICP